MLNFYIIAATNSCHFIYCTHQSFKSYCLSIRAKVAGAS
nr:MAG TPA: hypothetical protein [Caudoviricetes sp.]